MAFPLDAKGWAPRPPRKPLHGPLRRAREGRDSRRQSRARARGPLPCVAFPELWLSRSRFPPLCVTLWTPQHAPVSTWPCVKPCQAREQSRQPESGARAREGAPSDALGATCPCPHTCPVLRPDGDRTARPWWGASKTVVAHGPLSGDALAL